MGIPFILPMGFLFTVTMGIFLTIALGIQLTISNSARERPTDGRRGRDSEANARLAGGCLFWAGELESCVTGESKSQEARIDGQNTLYYGDNL